MNNNKTAVFLYDKTGIMAMPWVKAGYNCLIVDNQHKEGIEIDEKYPNLSRLGTDLRFGLNHHVPDNIVFIAGFPPCTHTAVSGAKHFKSKGVRALALSLDLFATTKELAEKTGAPYMIEHPVSTIKSYAGDYQHIFHPFEYGGYLPENDIHPLYPEYIKPRDSYPKKTCIWSGNGFVMPKKKPVDVESGWSTQQKKLGGKSLKTKNIRSATPRGFAEAVFISNSKILQSTP